MYYGIGILTIILVIWLINFFKALKDPNVKAASDLRMSIRNYNLYKKIFDEHWACMQKYGADSIEAKRLFAQLFKEVKNPNEWRRYERWRLEQMPFQSIDQDFLS